MSQAHIRKTPMHIGVFLMDLPGIEPGPQQCECCVIPFYYRPSCPRRESNADLRLRSPLFYPLNYGGTCYGEIFYGLLQLGNCCVIHYKLCFRYANNLSSLNKKRGRGNNTNLQRLAPLPERTHMIRYDILRHIGQSNINNSAYPHSFECNSC